jgi:hypothetical protein
MNRLNGYTEAYLQVTEDNMKAVQDLVSRVSSIYASLIDVGLSLSACSSGKISMENEKAKGSVQFKSKKLAYSIFDSFPQYTQLKYSSRK